MKVVAYFGLVIDADTHPEIGEETTKAQAIAIAKRDYVTKHTLGGFVWEADYGTLSFSERVVADITEIKGVALCDHAEVEEIESTFEGADFQCLRRVKVA